MAFAVAVVTEDDMGLTLLRLLSTLLRNVPDLSTSRASTLPGVGRISSIIKPREYLLTGSRPSISLDRSLRLVGEAVRDAPLLAHVSLKIHVGEDGEQLALEGDEPEADVVADEALLQLAVGGRAVHGLHILLDGLLGVVDVALGHGLLDLRPGVFGGDGGDVVAVDHASILALLANMT